MNIRELNDAGIQAAHEFLDAVKAGDALPIPWELLEDEDLSIDLGVSLKSLPTGFESRFALALWLNRTLESVLRTERVNSAGMWTWLTLRMLDMLAPQRADGTRKLGERALYVLEPDNWRRYYRHLLAGPCRVMLAHWDELHVTQAILNGKPNVPGELYEQIAANSEIITSRALVGLTRRLYWDANGKTLKRGASSKGAGSARRLAALLGQLDLTWDLAEMSESSILNLLPKREFGRFTRASDG